MVKCLTHGLRGFNGAVQRRLAALTVTMLISLCWQQLSEVELRRISDICKQWANSGSHEFVMQNKVRYMRPHARFAHCSCKNAALTLDLGLSASAADSCCIFTLAVRPPPVLTSRIEIYYFHIASIENSFFRAAVERVETVSFNSWIKTKSCQCLLPLFEKRWSDWVVDLRQL